MFDGRQVAIVDRSFRFDTNEKILTGEQTLVIQGSNFSAEYQFLPRKGIALVNFNNCIIKRFLTDSGTHYQTKSIVFPNEVVEFGTHSVEIEGIRDLSCIQNLSLGIDTSFVNCVPNGSIQFGRKMLRSALDSLGYETGQHEKVISDVSRTHAELTFKADRIEVKDLSSTNGTFYLADDLSWKRISSVTALRYGTAIMFGSLPLLLVRPEAVQREITPDFEKLPTKDLRLSDINIITAINLDKQLKISYQNQSIATPETVQALISSIIIEVKDKIISSGQETNSPDLISTLLSKELHRRLKIELNYNGLVERLDSCSFLSGRTKVNADEAAYLLGKLFETAIEDRFLFPNFQSNITFKRELANIETTSRDAILVCFDNQPVTAFWLQERTQKAE